MRLCSHQSVLVLQNTTILPVRNPSVVYDQDATDCNQKMPFMTVLWTTEPGNNYLLLFEFVSIFLHTDRLLATH